MRRILMGCLLLFVSVQVSALAHLAEHEFEAHEHFGQACDIFHYTKHAGDGALVWDVDPGTACTAQPVLVSLSVIFLPDAEHLLAQPRAPPVSPAF